jgi:hypothetical protein
MSETVNLVLKTTSISIDNTVANYFNQTVTNNIGTIAQNRSSITWNNINLKNLLGEMYDRYERFNISLNFMCGARTGIATEAIADYRTFYVRMRGLNFTSSYDQKTGNNDNSVILTSLRIPTPSNSVWDLANITTTYFTFIKQETVNINIDLINVFSDTYYVPSFVNAMIGHFELGLTITGIEDYKNIEKSENQNADLELRKIF